MAKKTVTNAQKSKSKKDESPKRPSEYEQQEIFECFARKLEESLDETRPNRPLGRQGVIQAVNEECGEKWGPQFRKLDPRKFNELMEGLYREGYIQFRHRRRYDLSEKLLKREPAFSALDKIIVVGGSDKERWGQAAAEEFIKCMFEAADHKARQGSGDSLNCGLFSGNTTAQLIHSAIAINWNEHFGRKVSDLGNVRIFALNLHLTGPKHIWGNATILAAELAAKINKEAGGKQIAKPYGLWGPPLLIEKSKLAAVDNESQNAEVLQYTEPDRVQEELSVTEGQHRKITQKTDSELDIVLTGVGALPENQEDHSADSIFYRLAREFKINIEDLRSTYRTIGDIGFTAITSHGEPVALRKEEKEYIFYSAAQIEILEAMAQDPNKSVFLVARDKNKVPVIHASVAGKHKYATHLIMDEPTCSSLLYY